MPFLLAPLRMRVLPTDKYPVVTAGSGTFHLLWYGARQKYRSMFSQKEAVRHIPPPPKKKKKRKKER